MQFLGNGGQFVQVNGADVQVRLMDTPLTNAAGRRVPVLVGELGAALLEE